MGFRPDIWILGLPLVAAIAAIGAWRLAPEIETGLRQEIQAEEGRNAASELGRSGARVEVEGRDLSVTTDAPLAPGGIADAKRLVGIIPGLRGPVFRVAAPSVAQPFTFSATRTGSALVLAGHVPPGPLRAELLDEGHEGGAALRDDLRSALGAPERFEEAARTILRIARHLDGASVSLTDRAVSVTGEAPDTRSYREATALLRTLPPGYSQVKVEIRPPLIRPYTWSASREREVLVLGGHVPSDAERDILVAFAKETGPASRIDDRMDTARGLEAGVDFDAVAKRVLGVLAQLESGRAELKGRALVLEGKLAARDLRDRLEGQIRSACLPGVDLERLELTPVVPRPYRLSARRRDGRLVLAGFVPTEGDRAALRDVVQRRFPFDAIVDDIHLADGAPDALIPAARVGLERLSALAEGEVSIEDRKLRVSGKALYPELARRTQRDMVSAAPSGWAASADVSVIPNKPLDPGFCGDLVSDVLGREPLRFDAGKAELAPAARKTLADVADVMRRCGTAGLVVVSTVETTADPEPARDLAERRASAIVAALGDVGVTATPQASASKVAEGARAGERIALEVRP